MPIPQDFIDDLMSRVDIVELIDSRVPLKKAGRNYTACCPFHSEKTPSFTVSPEKQFYHCFGCGAHGSAARFLMEYDHMSFPEAIEELAGTVGMEVPREAGPRKPSNTGLYDLLEKVAAYYRKQLQSHPQAGKARRYLRERGLDQDVVERFGIGFAPPGWDNLRPALGAGSTDQARIHRDLLRTGMTVEKEGGHSYDRFRERIMFPIRDRRGRTIAFGGRAFGDDKPKYLNSPETELFHKGRELYGLYEAVRAHGNLTHLLVVEGYMDVVALAQYGIRYAVATLGTATTADHLQRLFLLTPKLVFCFDGDRAGREAAWRALETSLPFMEGGRQVGFLLLPEGEDPDTLVRKTGSGAFEERVRGAESFSEFFYASLGKQVDLGSLDGRARLVELSRPLLHRIPDGVFRRMMLDRLAELAGMDRQELSTLLERADKAEEKAARPRQHPSGWQAAEQSSGPPPVGPSLGYSAQPANDWSGGPDIGWRSERAPGREAEAAAMAPRSLLQRAMQLLLHDPGLAAGVEDGELELLKQAQGEWTGILVQMLELARRRPQINSGAYYEHWSGTTTERILARLARYETVLPPECFAMEFRATLTGLMQEVLKQRIEVLLATGDGDPDGLRELFKQQAELQQRRRELGREGDA